MISGTKGTGGLPERRAGRDHVVYDHDRDVPSCPSSQGAGQVRRTARRVQGALISKRSHRAKEGYDVGIDPDGPQGLRRRACQPSSVVVAPFPDGSGAGRHRAQHQAGRQVVHGDRSCQPLTQRTGEPPGAAFLVRDEQAPRQVVVGQQRGDAGKPVRTGPGAHGAQRRPEQKAGAGRAEPSPGVGAADAALREHEVEQVVEHSLSVAPGAGLCGACGSTRVGRL
jgi:hypothetical protein